MTREDDLNIDPVEVHILELHARIFVALTESSAERAIPCFGMHQRPVAKLFSQMAFQAFIGLRHMAIGIDNRKIFHWSSLFDLFGRFGVCSSRRTIKAIEKATLVQF